MDSLVGVGQGEVILGRRGSTLHRGTPQHSTGLHLPAGNTRGAPCWYCSVVTLQVTLLNSSAASRVLSVEGSQDRLTTLLSCTGDCTGQHFYPGQHQHLAQVSERPNCQGAAGKTGNRSYQIRKFFFSRHNVLGNILACN